MPVAPPDLTVLRQLSHLQNSEGLSYLVEKQCGCRHKGRTCDGNFVEWHQGFGRRGCHGQVVSAAGRPERIPKAIVSSSMSLIFRLNGLLTKNTCQQHSAVSGVNPDAVSVQFVDPTVAGLERSLAARAFERLAERWQASRRPASALSTNGI